MHYPNYQKTKNKRKGNINANNPIKMMDIVQITLLGVILFGVLIGAIILRNGVLYKRSNSKGDVDYRAFFVIGVTYLGAGVALSISLHNLGFYGIVGIGLLFISIGLQNQDKW
jgi:hypothetical protein